MKPLYIRYFKQKLPEAVRAYFQNISVTDILDDYSGKDAILDMLNYILHDARLLVHSHIFKPWYKKVAENVSLILTDIENECSLNGNFEHDKWLVMPYAEEFLNNMFWQVFIDVNEENTKKKKKKKKVSLKNLPKIEKKAVFDTSEDTYPDMGKNDDVDGDYILFREYIQDCKDEENTQKDSSNDAIGKRSEKRHNAEATYFSRIPKSIRKMANKIGRNGDYDGINHINGKFPHASKNDIDGAAFGDDLNAILPNEIVKLACKETEDIFYKQYVQKQLQVFYSKSKDIHKDMGPIIICLDTSGSMEGMPEKVAKTLTLAICIVAQKSQRTVWILKNGQEDSFVLVDLNRQRKGLLKYLLVSMGGGINVDYPLSYAMYGYKNGNYSGNADILAISDFLIKPIKKELYIPLKKDGIKFWGLYVKSSPDSSKDKIPEMTFCDFKYQYNLRTQECIKM